MERFFLAPTSFPKDPNPSFSYLRSFVLFYYLTQLFPSSTTLFTQFYPQEYYPFYQTMFEQKQNSLLFTYYNCLPSTFYPLLDQLYYYSPIVTFYTNETKTLYQQQDIELSPKKKLWLRPDRTEVPHEIRITLPTALLSRYPIHSSWWLLLKYQEHIYVGTHGEVQGDTFSFTTLYRKNPEGYHEEKTHLRVSLQEIEYLCCLQPLTKEAVLDVFPLVTLKKGSYVYANYKKEDPSHWGQFFALYPFLNILESFGSLNLSWNCFSYQVKKDISLVHINIDPFYANPIVGYDDPEGEDYDMTDQTYTRRVKRDLFRCTGSKEELRKKKNCNLNVLYDFQNQTWMKNMSRTMLMLLIFKHKNYLDFQRFYYLDFLKKLGFQGMINHTGIYRKRHEDIYLETEIAFTSPEISQETLQLHERKNGACEKHYPKRR